MPFFALTKEQKNSTKGFSGSHCSQDWLGKSYFKSSRHCSAPWGGGAHQGSTPAVIGSLEQLLPGLTGSKNVIGNRQKAQPITCSVFFFCCCFFGFFCFFAGPPSPNVFMATLLELY